MGRLDDIEAEWLLRPLRFFRIDPAETRMWAALLAVLGGIGLTLVGGWLVLRRLGSIIHIFIRVDAYNRSVAQDRMVVMTGAGAMALSLLGLAWWRRRRARYLRQAIGVEPRYARAEMWLLIAAAVLVVVTAVLLCVFCLTYLPLDGPSWRHL